MAINKAMLAALRALSYPELDIKKTYKFERSLKAAAGRAPRLFYAPWDHMVLRDDYEIPVRMFLPGGGAADHALLFFHGGGWVTGNIDSYDKVCANMAKVTGLLVASVDYRLAPEHHFPTAPEDCYAVAKELFLHGELLGIPPENVTLIGDSAGANLAAVVSLMARDRGEFSPGRQILFYPATYNDHTEASPFLSVRENGTDYLLSSRRICDYMSLYRASDDDLTNPYYAPLLAPDLSRQPDTLVITAQYDPLRDEGIAYGEALKLAGNHVESHCIPNALHGFLSLPPRFSHVKQAYEIILPFLAR